MNSNTARFDRHPALKAPRARIEPAAIVMPTMMNEAFIASCQGEQTLTDEGLECGPHAVFPRSLMTRTFKLNGDVQADATTSCATKNCAARSQAMAPSRTFIQWGG